MNTIKFVHSLRLFGLTAAVFCVSLLAIFIAFGYSNVNAATSCPSGQVLASDGECYDGDLYDPDYLCSAGYSEYCNSGDGVAGDPWACPDNQVMDAAGNCQREDTYTDEQLCDAGETQYCQNSTGGSSGSCHDEYTEDNWSDVYDCSSATYTQDVDCVPGTTACYVAGASYTDPNAQDGFYTNTYIVDANTGSQHYVNEVYFGPDEGCGFDRSVEKVGNGAVTNYYYTPIPADQCMTSDGSGGNNPPDTTPTDRCPNISGMQSSIPSGYHLEGGQCVENSDVCPNINGVQTSVPSGYELSGGQCVPTPSCSGGGKGGGGRTCTCPSGYSVQGNHCASSTPDLCPNIDGTQSSVPSGYVVQGNQCVPSSCPTGQSLQSGVCRPITCPAGYTLQGNNCVSMTCPAGFILQGGACVRNCVNQCAGLNVVNSCTGAVVTTCSYQCSLGICTEPPPPEVTTWRVTPLLIQRGNTVRISWDVENVTGCIVSRTSGGNWTGVSGSHTEVVTEETTYTLSCVGVDGSPIQRTGTVRIVPTFQEV